MSLSAAITVAVRNALYAGGKDFDLNQVMDQFPYSYDTPGKMRDFLTYVGQQLSQDTPPITLNMNQIDPAAAMADKIIDLENRIAAACTGDC
jgi:hypothetical protein